jgi:predicted phosphodiesterase
MIITFISDTHTKHRQVAATLPGGDLLIHSGDLMNSGYRKNDILEFLDWFDGIKGYDKKVFIAGNHDRYFEDRPDEIKDILADYPNIIYLEDQLVGIYDLDTDKSTKIWGSPWQPEFYDWAFNLPRQGKELKEKWDAIPEGIDILITHGPAWGFLDDVDGRRGDHLGCELLAERIKQIKPKIHVCGHIHSGYGHYFDGHTHYFNASVLNERYLYSHTPWTIDWDPITNEIKFV